MSISDTVASREFSTTAIPPALAAASIGAVAGDGIAGTAIVGAAAAVTAAGLIGAPRDAGAGTGRAESANAGTHQAAAMATTIDRRFVDSEGRAPRTTRFISILREQSALRNGRKRAYCDEARPWPRKESDPLTGQTHDRAAGGQDSDAKYLTARSFACRTTSFFRC
ncbi:MAG: hypothetical protein QM674_02380 [Burkholderiaceae bacterium]